MDAPARMKPLLAGNNFSLRLLFVLFGLVVSAAAHAVTAAAPTFSPAAGTYTTVLPT
jgi:hypothetical protein